MIYKKGSKGDEVKKIQKVVGCAADGIFGANTESAVKKWQTSHGLSADGIVGPHTYEKMFGTPIAQSSKCIGKRTSVRPKNSKQGSAVSATLFSYGVA